MFYDESLHGKLLELRKMDSDHELQDVFDRNDYDIMLRIVDCIDIGYNLDLNYIPVLTVIGYNFDMGIEPAEFLEKLNLTELFFKKIEDYEMCGRIKDLRDRILD